MSRYLYLFLGAVFLAIAAGQSKADVVFFRLAEKLPILLAVLLAAVFVRLARGMPTIPHEKISADKAIVATKAFRSLISAYVQTFVIFLVTIFLNLSVASLSGYDFSTIPYKIVPTILAIFDVLSLVSLFYMVNSDVKLAKVQADLMDEVIGQGSNERAKATVSKVSEAFKTSRHAPAVTSFAEDQSK